MISFLNDYNGQFDNTKCPFLEQVSESRIYGDSFDLETYQELVDEVCHMFPENLEHCNCRECLFKIKAREELK